MFKKIILGLASFGMALTAGVLPAVGAGVKVNEIAMEPVVLNIGAAPITDPQVSTEIDPNRSDASVAASTASTASASTASTASTVASADTSTVDSAAKDSTATENSWAKAFCLFFEKLGNWFRGVFTKWKFNCFISNEEWKARFGA